MDRGNFDKDHSDDDLYGCNSLVAARHQDLLFNSHVAGASVHPCEDAVSFLQPISYIFAGPVLYIYIVQGLSLN